VLTADLVRIQRKGEVLRVRGLDEKTREIAVRVAGDYLSVADAAVSDAADRESLEAALSAVEVPVRIRRVADGLRKLLLDRCEFEQVEGDPPAVRRAVFEAAASARAALESGQEFDREAVLASVAADLGLETEAVESLLFADLRAAHRLVRCEAPGADSLVRAYETGQAQAVLLRATRVEVELDGAGPGGWRALFHKLKFLRLLHRITPLDGGGHRIEIDGPFSLFSASTKYGLQLAMLLPALDACGAWRLRADVRWGKDKKTLRFEHEGGRGASEDADGAAPVHLSDEVQTLVKRFRGLKTSWSVRPAKRVLELPGVGLCVPDLVFSDAARGARVYLEVMGFWSRDAVWRRVELVEAGLDARILFCVSSRLRVSEAALDGETSGALYVYKGVMNARRIAEKLDVLAGAQA
jgi:predicted nuclease of restriction endonuclease-like RecB superfamily